MSKNLTDEFTEGLYKLSKQDFSGTVIREAKNCLLDYIGVTIVGAKIIKEKSLKSIEVLGDVGDCSIVGLETRSSIQTAMLFNGIHAHIVELDDGHRVAMMHPGAPVISALLPLAQQKNISGIDFLRGIILGYEASIRLASVLQPSMKDKGFHGTGIAGTIGAAVGIATALKFSKEQMKDAISAAVTSASGILKVIKDISELKPYNVGNAARNGYIAAMLGLTDFKGPKDVFGGKLGFLMMMSENYNKEFLQFKENEKLSILSIYRKPYAACRHCHSPIEAALNIKKTHQLDINRIKSVNIETYYWAVGGHDHVDVIGINSAKMSTPYSVAVALVKSKAGLSEFTTEIINNTEVINLAKKVKVKSSEELTLLVPHKRAAILNIETNDGLIYTERVDYPKGEPENPITDEELKEKFFSLMQYSEKSHHESQKLMQIVDNLETDLDKIFQYL
ncbi:MAG: MmgE/PrpD family protein [Bacteroidetes bacterium]|jgi:2-methylcitrate dehydratase PrpD|nr:MmgE/PrpD family protein [Bacteroidota bacterium]